jgi:CRISP-associated protein Cas1
MLKARHEVRHRVIVTVLGQKNHYNVKLLKGYGVSINLKDNRLCLKGVRDPFKSEQETEEWFVYQIPTSV